MQTLHITRLCWLMMSWQVTVDEVRIRPASLMIHQSIYRPNQNKPATTATITLACVINDKKTIHPHRLPKKFVQTLISATAV